MSQAKIEIYSTDYCPYCTRAKNLITSLGQEYVEYDITNDDKGRAEALDRSGGMRTVPQIFINDKHIGGFDDLNALHMKGQLEPLFK